MSKSSCLAKDPIGRCIRYLGIDILNQRTNTGCKEVKMRSLNLGRIPDMEHTAHRLFLAFNTQSGKKAELHY